MMAIAVEAILGAGFGELLKAVYDVCKTVKSFKPTFQKLQSTLIQISPAIEKIEKLNAELGRPKEELQSLITKMEEGTELVRKCSQIRKRDFLVKAYHYQKQLDSLAQDLATFFNINMQAHIVRDQKEILVKIKTLLDERNKLAMDTNGASSDSNTTPERSPIIGSQYCRTSCTMLEIVRTVEKLGFSNEFEVKDDANKVIFHLKRPSFSKDRLYTLFDYHGNPIITLHNRIMTAHHRWEVYRGEETNELLFNIKRKHIMGRKGRLEVFLAENTSDETKCDFMIIGNTKQGSYSVFAGHSRDSIAQVDNEYNAIGCSKQGDVVRVKPNVDFAFIVALFVVILSLS